MALYKNKEEKEENEVHMSITLANVSKMSEADIAAMLDFDTDRSIAFIESKLKAFEHKYGMTTIQMRRKYKDNVEAEPWVQDWLEYYVMLKDLRENR